MKPGDLIWIPEDETNNQLPATGNEKPGTGNQQPVTINPQRGRVLCRSLNIKV
jgi:hypothetical protein